MIISASRRTDLPAAHAVWLENRFREGFVLVRNPMNPRQVSRVSLRPEDVDGIVFWTKDPAPMLERLSAFEPYAYYFQFTLTGYGRDVEPCLPDVQKRAETFLRLSERLGPERVLWRYDPILLSPSYPESRHLEMFARLAKRLKGATAQVTVSFVDIYARNRKRLEALQTQNPGELLMRALASQIARIARANGMTPVACAEPVNLSDCGILPARCVDADRLSRIGGVPVKAAKDPTQRSVCGCAVSTDIGAYNSCPHGCLYCYANYSPAILKKNLSRRDDQSPILCDALRADDQVKDRAVTHLRQDQIRMEI